VSPSTDNVPSFDVGDRGPSAWRSSPIWLVVSYALIVAFAVSIIVVPSLAFIAISAIVILIVGTVCACVFGLIGSNV